MPLHVPPMLCLCSRDMFGDQEQLFPSLTSSQRTLYSIHFLGSNACCLMVQLCYVLHVTCVKSDGWNLNTEASFESDIIYEIFYWPLLQACSKLVTKGEKKRKYWNTVVSSKYCLLLTGGRAMFTNSKLLLNWTGVFFFLFESVGWSSVVCFFLSK